MTVSHENVLRFDTVPPRDLILLAQGTMWPTAVIVDGERWNRTEKVVEASGRRAVRMYALASIRPGAS